jgi:hypothetical protein
MQDQSSAAQKTCSICHQTKPLSEFQPNGWHKNVQYYRPHCRPCYRAERRHSRPHKGRFRVDPSTTDRRCSRCRILKSLDDFPPQSGATLGRSYWCRRCKAAWKLAQLRADPERYRAQRRAQYAVNREREIAQRRSYRIANRDEINTRRAIRRAANPEPNRRRARAWRLANLDRFDAGRQLRRARKRGVREARFSAKEWSELQALFDSRCVYCWQRPLRLTQEHVQPLSRGGRHDASNIVPACAPCNYSKQRKNLLEFLLYRARITKWPAD